jgi:uncharacterized protein involved in exopolysaccharide biosynthesis
MARLIILRLLDSYFRHRWLNLLPLVLMIGLAGASLYLAEPQYVSRGRLYVQKASLLPSLTQIGNEGFSWQSPTQLAVSEFNELVQTEAFVRSVIQKTDLEAEMSAGPDAVRTTIEQFRKSLSISMVGDSVIEIGVKNKDPKLAQQLAAATIDSYSLWKLNGDRQESTVAQQFFATVLPGYQEDLQKARDAMKAYLISHPVPLRGERPAQEQLELSQLQSAVDVATKRVESALEKEESARLAQTQAESSVRQNYMVIDAPVEPLKSESSLREQLMGPAIFVLVGIMLTFAGIAGGVLLDRSFRFPLDVHNSLDLPVLALVPDVSRVEQPPVLNEPTQTISHHQEHNGFDSATVVRIPHKHRRARQQVPLAPPASNGHTELADTGPALSDETTA